MADNSSTDADIAPQPAAFSTIGGGVNLAADQVTIAGDLIGRDKIVGYTAEQVGALLIQVHTTFQPRSFEGRCPYIGLTAFDENNADLFFGREVLVSDLEARMKAARCIVIAGPSGCGKSSLVRAGLIHALKQNALPNSDRWLYAILTPHREPLEQLALALARVKDSPQIAAYFRAHQSEVDVLNQCAEALLEDRADQRLFLFVDQFEEVFTQVVKEVERTTFLNQLTYAATAENGRVIVLFAMRSDFVSNCAAYPQLNALLNQQFFQVGAMQPPELEAAVALPALSVSLAIDPELSKLIIQEMHDEPGALPLMQFALKDLFDAQQARGGLVTLRPEDYLARGGLHKSLERYADAVFAKLSDGEQQLAHSIFSGLVEIGRGRQDTRRTAMLDELVPADVDALKVESVVQELVDARLITTDERDNTRTVTLAHEALIDAWPWLRKLVNENREVIALQNQIAEDAQEWEYSQRDPSYLYVGAHLANAREQLAAKKIVLSGLAQAFVKASVEAEEAKHRQEEAHRQKELGDARRLADMAEARARAEVMRTRLLLGLLLLGMIAIFTMALAIPTVQGMMLRQQAMIPMVAFPATEVYLGADGQTGDENGPHPYLPHQVYSVGAFAIDSYLVTNHRYLLCVQAGVCLRPISGSGDYLPVERANLPVVNVTASQAYQFCNWLGAQLPDEREWERAARAGTTSEDVFDLTGQVWEWTRSNYELNGEDWSSIDADPPDEVSARGGGANSASPQASDLAYRKQADPWVQQDNIGFRCAVTR